MLLGVLLAAGPALAQAAPWSARRRPVEAKLIRTGWSLIDVAGWPAEPATPELSKDPAAAAKLASALRALCRKLKPADATDFARWIIQYGAQFDVDPMLLAGLVYQEGRCRTKSTDYGVGLTRLNAKMHRRHWSTAEKAYTYFMPSSAGKGWAPKTQSLPLFRFNRWVAKKPQPNIYFTAALLSVFQRQCPHIDNAHGVSKPHRSPVSHFIWGDKVHSSHEEDEILIARRRVLRHYTGVASSLRGGFRGLQLHSPLEGPPRKLTGAWGDPREGRRKHKGVDFASSMAEPVLAVADGVVSVAGADLEGRPTTSFSPARALRLSRSQLGRAGLIVLLDHADGLTSGYMHLLKYTVRAGEKVRAGQVIGYVGRSGIKNSSAHLHFDLRVDGKRVDPVPLLGALVIDPMATTAGRWRKRRWDKAAEKAKKARQQRRQQRALAKKRAKAQ